jgi:hypothetical protein
MTRGAGDPVHRTARCIGSPGILDCPVHWMMKKGKMYIEDKCFLAGLFQNGPIRRAKQKQIKKGGGTAVEKATGVTDKRVRELVSVLVSLGAHHPSLRSGHRIRGDRCALPNLLYLFNSPHELKKPGTGLKNRDGPDAMENTTCLQCHNPTPRAQPNRGPSQFLRKPGTGLTQWRTQRPYNATTRLPAHNPTGARPNSYSGG